MFNKKYTNNAAVEIIEHKVFKFIGDNNLMSAKRPKISLDGIFTIPIFI